MDKNWLYKAFSSVLSCPVIIHERVQKALNSVPDGKKDTEKVVEYLIADKCKKTAMIGGATAFPGNIPGIGTIGTIASAVSVELFAVTKLEIEMCMEIADLYGWDIDNEERVIEILDMMAKCGKIKFSDADDEILKRMVQRAVKTGFVRLLLKVSERIGFKMLRRTFLKIVPWIGVPVSAKYNMESTKQVGYLAKQLYSVRKKKRR